jgi:endonuclease/exonuclease/phosphatase family metal-dependent hydrolase
MRPSSKTPGKCLGTPAEGISVARTETFGVATYNIENYLDASSSKGRVKSAESKAKVRESIRAINPDVLALQEVGSVATLMEFRASLKAEGFDFPHWEHVTGSDADLHVAILSRFPFSARRAHTGDSFELGGHRFRVRRGFAEVDVQVNAGYQFTLFVAHLKSRNAVPDGDAAGLRLEEAKLLRAKIDARLAISAEAKIIVLGDFNDTEDSAAVKTIRGVGGGELFDTRPTEASNGTAAIPLPGIATQGAAWTTFYEGKDRYDRIDYVLISKALKADWVAAESHVLAIPGWKTASDHRPVVAVFKAGTGQRVGSCSEQRTRGEEGRGISQLFTAIEKRGGR